VTSRRVLLRCDAGAVEQIGTGHLARCLLVADVLRGRGAHVAFCGRYDAGVEERIAAAGHPVTAAEPAEEEPALLARAVAEHDPEVLVIDRLDTRAEDVAAVRGAVPVILTVDDKGEGAALADMVVNAIVGGGDPPYESYEYLVVTPPQPALTDERRRPRVVLSFGGYDHRRLGEQVAGALDGRIDADVLWLVRSTDRAPESVPAGVQRIEDAPDFATLLAGADAAVVAGGLTLFEALANGVPCVALPQYDHQADTIARLAERGAVLAVDGDGDGLGERAADALAGMLADDDRRRALRNRGMEAIDGRGLHRFADLVTVAEQLPWDSSYFGLPIARIHPLRLTTRILDLALREAEEAGIACTYYLCDCHHAESVRLAEAAGFHFVDIRLTFERALDGEAGELADGVREATAEDLPALLPVARSAYVHSRYYFDHRFPVEQCERFYSDWLEKCVKGELGSEVFVLEDEDGPTGYIALDHQTAVTASISLVGVAERARGTGVGRRLVQHALAWARSEGYSRMEVVTQGRNYEAQRLYQRSRFVTKKTELWYHRWAA
jgi:spore coat polysaccharide biosynthesis predicted glycosyltransferase SpsG/ribosomal protein S18 acetylase RimI-like enzyme